MRAARDVAIAVAILVADLAVRFGLLAFNCLIVLQLLRGADRWRVFPPDQLHALTGFFVGAYWAGYRIGGVLFAVGTAAICYALFKLPRRGRPAYPPTPPPASFKPPFGPFVPKR